MIAVAESFSIDRILAGWPDIAPASINTWAKRENAWRRVGADLALAKSWLPLMGYVEVRNALQHGLGRLTDQQFSRRDQTLRRLVACGVRLNGDRLFVTDKDVDRCYRVCREFVAFADESAASARAAAPFSPEQ